MDPYQDFMESERVFFRDLILRMVVNLLDDTPLL